MLDYIRNNDEAVLKGGDKVREVHVDSFHFVVVQADCFFVVIYFTDFVILPDGSFTFRVINGVVWCGRYVPCRCVKAGTKHSENL